MGEPLVRRAARSALAIGAHPVLVVLGAHADLIAPALDGLAGVTCIVHPDWSEGLGSSLAAGVRALDGVRLDPGPLDGVLLALADQPLVDAAAHGALLAAFGGPQAIVAAAYAGTVGVPAIVGREHLDPLRAMQGDAGAGRWLRTLGTRVTAVPLAAAAFDVDTEADVARLTGPLPG